MISANQQGPTSGILYLDHQSHEQVLNSLPIELQNQINAEERRYFPPPRLDAVLWRYLETYKFEDLLKTGTLYLRQVEKLAKDEPNEGRMNRLQEEALAEQFKDDPQQIEHFRAFHRNIRQRSWVTCFSMDSFAMDHMWAKFCPKNSGEGVAIQTTYKRLKSSMHAHTDCAKVRYEKSKHMPWKIGYLLFQKAPEFAYEKEVRVCVVKQDISSDDIRIPVDLSRLIHRIHVHPKASNAYKDFISDIASKYLSRNQWRVK